jgi:phosphopantothenoylcysteine synthetase/decarboxylase
VAVLYVVACGGRPAADLPGFIRICQDKGWEVCVIGTPSATKFLDPCLLADLTGHVVRFDYKQPDEPDVLPPADVFVVAPATFNTINKWAQGISDTLALGLLNEAVGLGMPIVALPWPNRALAKHPAFTENIARLRGWGVQVIFDPERHPLPLPNMGPPGNDLFPWKALEAAIANLRGRRDIPRQT